MQSWPEKLARAGLSVALSSMLAFSPARAAQFDVTAVQRLQVTLQAAYGEVPFICVSDMSVDLVCERCTPLTTTPAGVQCTPCPENIISFS